MRAEVLREKGGFTAPDFTIFRGVLTDFLKQPKNHLGLEGPGRHVSQRQQAWEEWLDEFIDEKIGRMFWGQGTTRKWSYPAERDKIREFMKESTIDIAYLMRCKENSRIMKASHTKEEPKSDSNPSVSTDAPSELDTITMPIKRPRGRPRKSFNPIEITDSTIIRPPGEDDRGLKRKRSLVEIAPSSSRPHGFRLDINIDPTVINVDSGGGPSTVTSRPQPPLPPAQPLLLPPQPPLLPQPPLPPVPIPQQAPPPLPQPQNPPVPRDPPQERGLDFVLETSIEGPGEIKLIYGVDVPSLAQLVEMIRRKHHLKPEQDIRAMKVRIGGKIFSVDLDEQRDWKYISGVVVEYGGRAEMVVSIVS